MKVHLLAIIPLCAFTYFFLSDEGYIPRFKGDLIVWLLAFVVAIVYHVKIHQQIKKKLNRRKEDE